MKQSNRLLKILIATAVGILLFTGAVFAILNLTSGDSNKKSTSSSSQKSESNKNKTEDKKKKEQESSKDEKKKEEDSNTKDSESNSSKKDESSNNNSTSSKTVTNSSNNSTENKKVEKPATNSNETAKENEQPKENSNIDDNPNYTTGRVYEHNGKKLSPIAGTGNTGQVFSSQAEAAAYGQAEVEKRVKETKKYTSYSVGRVLYEDGTQAGWTVDVYSGKPQQ